MSHRDLEETLGRLSQKSEESSLLASQSFYDIHLSTQGVDQHLRFGLH